MTRVTVRPIPADPGSHPSQADAPRRLTVDHPGGAETGLLRLLAA